MTLYCTLLQVSHSQIQIQIQIYEGNGRKKCLNEPYCTLLPPSFSFQQQCLDLKCIQLSNRCYKKFCQTHSGAFRSIWGFSTNIELLTLPIRVARVAWLSQSAYLQMFETKTLFLRSRGNKQFVIVKGQLSWAGSSKAIQKLSERSPKTIRKLSKSRLTFVESSTKAFQKACKLQQ